MATGFAGKFQTFVGFAGVVALGISAAMVSGVNPLHYAEDAFTGFLDKLQGELTEPLPRWSERVDGLPLGAAVTSDRVVVVINGAVESRRLTDGGPVWTRTVDWAVPAGDLVVTGRSNATGFEVLDANTGTPRWRDTKASDAWPYQDLVISLSCKRDACSVRARATEDGSTRWRVPVAANAQRLAGYQELDEAIDQYGTLRADYPGRAPRLIGVVADRQVTVIDTGSGSRLGELSEDSTTRVTTAGDRVLGVVATPARSGGCRYRVRAWRPSGAEVWRRSGYDFGTVSGSGCEQRVDPTIGGGAIAAVTPGNRPALLGVGAGELRWRGDPGTTILGVGNGLAVVRTKSGRLTAISTSSGGELWSRAASPDADVLLTGSAVVIQDRQAGRVTAVSPSGGVLRTWKSQATVIGADDAGLVFNNARTVGYAPW